MKDAGVVASKQALFEAYIESIYTSYSNPTYTNAFYASDGTTPASVDSVFKTMHYGPTSNSATILGSIKSTATTIFTEINAALDPMKAAYANLTATT